MILRRATPDDVDALTACLAAAYAPFQHLGLPAVAEGIAEDVAQLDVWVAELDGAVVGGIFAELGDKAHIVNLAVHPGAGGHGIGRALVDQVIQAAIAAGRAEIHLATHAQMTATQAFYRKSGWLEAGHDGDKFYFKRQLS
jgi:ribosomal protein S18 acetylase RimI-like enzyme